MQNNATAQKQNKFYSRLQLVVAITAVVVFICLIAAWFFPWVWHDPRPKPLGDRLEYIGKFNSGCAGFPCIGGGPPSATYYYATDMSVEEVMGYFKGASVKKSNAVGYSSSGYSYIYLDIKSPNGGFNTIINYYDNVHTVTEALHLQSTSKKMV